MQAPLPLTDFAPFPKMPRYSRDCVITEKIDGTNAQVVIIPEADIPIIPSPDGPTPVHPFYPVAKVGEFYLLAGSRTRWIVPEDFRKGGDNYGFAQWVRANASELVKLGPGRHFGEWYGLGINRAYGMSGRKFALFNTSRWTAMTHDYGVTNAEGVLIPCCNVVPTIYRGLFTQEAVEHSLCTLATFGSAASPRFMNPEGIVIYHVAANQYFKKTLKDDESPKGQVP